MKFKSFFRVMVTALVVTVISCFTINLSAQQSKEKSTFSGKVIEKENGQPLIGVVVTFPKYGVWAVTEKDGSFSAKGLPQGKTQIVLSMIGMLTIDTEVSIKGSNVEPMVFQMLQESFGLEEVVVTARSNKVGASTASSISRTAIEHMQATSLSDVMELLPGQIASNPTLNSPASVSLRQVQGDAQNSMGTSVVVNGSPVSNNANMQVGSTAQDGTLNTAFASSAGSGTDMRKIPVSNIESVDVIRGIPSVEYGDLTSGVIIINPKAGEYPLQARAKINPILTQASLGKGFNLGKKAGTLTADLDYANSLSDERRPFQSYRRLTADFLYSNNIAPNISSTTGFGFYSDLDAQKLDPSDARYQRKRSSYDTGFKFNTNILWNANKDIFKYLRFTCSAEYAIQEGYNQELKGNFGYMVTSAMVDGTVASNRLEPIYDASGTMVTNQQEKDPSAATNMLPYEYLTSSTTYGKPLSVFAKLVSNFSTETGPLSHRILVGANWNTDVNFGRGRVFDPLMPPSSGIRMRPFSDIPALNQFSAFVEENMETTIFKRALKVQIGLREDLIQPLRDNSNSVLSPRVNASYEIVPDVLTLRGGYGVTAKAPPLMYLYPDNAYYDFANYDNYGESGLTDMQRLSIVTTKVFDTSNSALKIAKNYKSEIGVELKLGKMSFTVTGYNEILKDGYAFGVGYDPTNSNYGSIQSFNIVKYQTLSNRPDQYPLISEKERSRVTVMYNMPLNSKESINKGLEFDLDFGQIKALRTSVVLTGAIMQSKLYSTVNSYYQKNPENGVYKDIGVYASGDGSLYDRISSNLRIIHNIPKIGFVVSMSVQTIWKDTHRYLGLENRYPIGYISATTLQYTQLNTGDEIPADVQKAYLSNREIPETHSPLFLFNLRLTKEVKKFGGFAFFVNNLFMHRPLEESKRNPGNYTYRNPEQFFGAELWVDLFPSKR